MSIDPEKNRAAVKRCTDKKKANNMVKFDAWTYLPLRPVLRKIVKELNAEHEKENELNK